MIALRSPSLRLALPLLCCASGLAACSGPTQNQVPAWSTHIVEYGQGQIYLGLRYRWVAERDAGGAVIRTPDGGEAQVRLFACGKPVAEVQEVIRQRLQSRIIASQFYTDRDAFYFRWFKGQTMSGESMGTAVAIHGPLLLSITSSTIQIDDLVGIAKRVRLGLPLPTIQSCFPLCGVKEAECKPEDAEDEG